MPGVNLERACHAHVIIQLPLLCPPDVSSHNACDSRFTIFTISYGAIHDGSDFRQQMLQHGVLQHRSVAMGHSPAALRQ